MGEAGFELSTAQRALSRRAMRHGPATNRVRVHLVEPVAIVDVRARLERAIGALEILRTSFPVAAGATAPLQMVSDSVPALGADGDELLVSFPGANAHLAVTVAPGALILRAADVVADHAALLVLGELLSGRAELDEDPLQYADFAGWEAEQRDDDSPERRLAAAFWPTAHPLDEAGTTPASSIASAPVEGAADAGPEVWLAAWITVLNRNARLDEDPELTVQVSGRSGTELAQAIGPYARSVTVGVPTLAGATAQDAAAQLATVLEQAERFAVWAPDPHTRSGFRALPAGSLDPDPDPSLADELVLVAGPDGTRATVHSAAGAADAQRLAGHLATVLAELAAGPETLLGDTTMLTEDELTRLLDIATGPILEPSDDTVLTAFNRHVASTPEAVALADGQRSLTYAELDRQASDFAAGLGALGAGADAPLGIVVDRGVDSLVAILGALRSGRPFHPVRSDLPPARMGEHLARGGVEMLVDVAGAYAARGPAPARLVTPDDIRTAAASTAALRPAAGPAGADGVAYLLATSGSTGTPKLVEVTHRNLYGYTRAVSERLGLAAGCRLGVLTSLSTDLAYTMVFPALVAGGTVRLFDEDEVADVRTLEAAVRTERIDAVKLTPSLLRALLARDDAHLGIGLLILGGEALSAELVERAYRAGAGRVVNHYGPTETTVGATTYEDLRGGEPGMSTPVGRPLPGVQAYVVDGDRQLSPHGVPGQLAVAGIGVSNGYRGDPDATAAAFVTLPFVDVRAYLTGDTVRLTGDGDLVFLGRSDGQVKVRGYRVELGDIEHALRDHPGVSDAVVVVDPRDAEADTLIAYVAGAPVSHAEVRAWLAERVPPHMVVEHVVSLSELPRMPNGKLDRSALPEPSLADADDLTEPANTDTERELLAIWVDVLPEGRLGVTDDFFYVGGHSLLATRIMARARADFGVDLPLHLIFSHTTVRTMSAEIDSRVASAHAAEGEAVDLDSVLASIEDMDEDEARLMLERELRRPPRTE